MPTADEFLEAADSLVNTTTPGLGHFRRAISTSTAAGVCAAYAIKTGGVGCVISEAMTAQWNYVAGNAYGDGKCVKIKTPTMWASAYSGDRCT
jgi:hypothetical protein